MSKGYWHRVFNFFCRISPRYYRSSLSQTANIEAATGTATEFTNNSKENTDLNNTWGYIPNYYDSVANTYVTSSPTSGTSATATIDNYALGSICPAGWTLPNYDTDIAPASIWNDGANPGALSTSGNFNSGSQSNVGSYGYWWSSFRYNIYTYNTLYFSGSSATRSNYNKDRGNSVRCMRSSS